MINIFKFFNISKPCIFITLFFNLLINKIIVNLHYAIYFQIFKSTIYNRVYLLSHVEMTTAVGVRPKQPSTPGNYAIYPVTFF